MLLDAPLNFDRYAGFWHTKRSSDGYVPFVNSCMPYLTLSFLIVIITICYVDSIDFINPTSSIDCGTSGEDCNLNCTTTSAGCRYTNITLYNNTNFNLICTSVNSCAGLSIYAYNVTNIQLIMDEHWAAKDLNLFIEGTRSDTVNVYCRDQWGCNFLGLRALAPNLNLNVHCQYYQACGHMLISGI